MSEDEFLSKLELSRMHANTGNVKDSSEVVSDMRSKYGL